MKYFQLGIWVLLLVSSLYVFLRFYFKMRADYFFKRTAQKLLDRQAGLNRRIFFSGRLIKRILQKIFKNNKLDREALLSLLLKGESDKAAKLLEKSGLVLESSGLRAFLNPESQIKTVRSLVKANPQDEDALTLLAGLYFATGDYSKVKLVLNNLNGKTPYARAKKHYWQAYYNLQEGDLLSATENGTRAVRLFNKQGYFYEEAETHLLLGTIYRISAVEDVSQFMLEAARKIFQSLGAGRKEAEALGNLGMLMVMQSRFEEADDYFQKAREIYHPDGQQLGEAEIINQEALTALIKKDFNEARRLAETALGMHQDIKNQEGTAFSLELLGHLESETKNWKQALEHAKQAQKIYSKTSNAAALLEALFLEAKANFELEENKAAEDILRKIIDFSKSHSSCFHVANAYNLLGLIYLKQGNLQRAKGLFQQSLDCELHNDRASGAAIDYANIAMIEYRRGQQEQAEKTLSTALEYAKADGETDLAKYLEEQLNKKSNRS